MKDLEKVFYSNLERQSVDEKFIPHEWVKKEYKFSDYGNNSLSEDVDLMTLNGESFIMDFPDNTFSEKIGVHPDFLNKDNEAFKQYICSIFLDISGSTEIALKYDLITVQKIKNAILSSGIYILKGFGGHVHRLQGDALFAFTGHSKLKKSDAILQALNAASSIQYFNSEVLDSYFRNELNVEPPKIRIGIDFGDDNEVLWSKYGIDNINEFTVTSVHADLASKLQHKAPKNNIILGENVYKYLDIPDFLLKDKTFMKDGNIEKDSYIINKSLIRYEMKIFEWKEYLNKISHFDNKNNNSFILKDPQHFQINGYYIDPSTSKKTPFFSEICLEKNFLLQFELKFLTPQHKNLVKFIEWKVKNYGYEAKLNDAAQPFLLEKYKNKFYCAEFSAYNGLHYLECILYNEQMKTIGKSYFSVFVHDNLYDNLNLNILGGAEE